MPATSTYLAFLLKGIILGFSIAAPVGPIGVICIRRSLSGGMRSGFATGLGAAAADGFYGAVAAFGLASVTGFLVAANLWLRFAGGIFLLWLGWKTFMKKPTGIQERDGASSARISLAGNFGSTFILTLTNPMTILSFTAIFMGLGLGLAEGDFIEPLMLVFGVFTGSSIWWLGLSTFFSFFRKHLTPASMVWINRFSGSVIGLFGAVILLDTIL